MKGLLIKDTYMVNKYCRPFLLLLIIFLVISCFGKGNLFLSFYPVLLVSLIPVNLISYDEKEKWNTYVLTLPYTKKDYVTSKYILGFIFIIVSIILSAITQLISASINDSFTFSSYFSMLAIMFFIGIVGPSILMPFIFKYGAEKGRIAYYLVIILLCVLISITTGSDINLSAYFSEIGIITLLIGLGIIIYTLSWLVSVRIYNDREL